MDMNLRTHKSAMSFRGFLRLENTHEEQLDAQWSHYFAGYCNLLPLKQSLSSLRQEAAQKAGHRGYRGAFLHGTLGLRAMHRKINQCTLLHAYYVEWYRCNV